MYANMLFSYYFAIKIMETNYDRSYLHEIHIEYFISKIIAIKYICR